MPLSKRASLQAQRMMREAFMELERVITVSDRAQLKNLSLEDVQEAALQVEKQLAASQSLRNMRRLAPLFTGLGYYSEAIEVLCNGTPYLPWLWAPIKLVLKISADYIEAFEQIIKVYSRLAEPLARFRLFDRSFSNNMEVQNTLAVYYSDILKFHGEVYKFVRRNAWQRLFATSWGRFQRRFDNIFADLKAHEDLVDKTVNAANLSEAKEMREKLEDWRQQEMAKFKKEEEERTSTEFRAVLSVLKVDETHQIKVFDNLISEANQNPGSCSWILQQPKIRSWARCERDTQFVVLHGFVGSGKSVLAAQIATFLRASENSLVAAHFCTYLYPESTDYNYIMRSLMIQIIRLDPELITLSYDWLVLKKKAPSNTVIEQLLRLLVEAMGALPEKQKTLHIIVDGLDECDDSTIASVVKTLDKLVASASSSAATLLKVLLCTQMKPEVIKFVKRKHQVSLSSEKDHLNKAIQDYTLQRINAIRPSLSQLRITDDDVTTLASQITQKADGMFLWAKLVMEYINKNLFYHRDEILKAAISLPRELGEFYGRMLSQIMANFDERSAQRISAVLSWIAFAKRPLRLAELLSALAFDTKQEQVDELVPAYILDRCEPLIQKQADSSYSFVHVSVRDFLQSSDTALLVTENESQKRHGLATVRCLLSGQQIFAPLYPDSDRTLRVLRGLHGFHMYATEFWVDYLLASLEFDQAQFFESDFFALSCSLAENFIAAGTDCEAADGSPSDTRLALIRQRHYPLYKMAKVVLLEQNKETIEATPVHDGSIPHDDMASDVIALKKRYQTTIQKLLNCSNYPGISFQQLEQFKQNFRTSAFTCRVWSCPYATMGFNNIDSLTRHEAEHSKHICRVQGCQYPVFTSARLLKNHIAEHHTSPDQRLKRSSIRKRPTLVSSASRNSATRVVEALEEDLYRIKCICGYSEGDGNTIYCETCDTWQHIGCFYPNNQEEAAREDFSHSCADCKPRSLDRLKAALRMRQLIAFYSPDLELTAGNSKPPSPYQPSSYDFMYDDSQMGSQMERNDPVPKSHADQDYEKQLILLEEQRRRHTAIAAQKSRQDEDGRRPLNNDNQPAGEQDSSFGLAHDGNKVIPALDEWWNGITFGVTNDDVFKDEMFKDMFMDDEIYKPISTTNSSSQPSLEPATSSDVFTQRVNAASNQHLNTVRNSPSSSTSRDASPFRQGSPLAPLPLHDVASLPQRSGYNVPSPIYPYPSYPDPPNFGAPEVPPLPSGPPITQNNGLLPPIPPRLRVGGLLPPIPPRLRVGAPRPPTPRPPLTPRRVLTPRPPPTPKPLLKAADPRPTLPDSTSASKTPHPYRQAPYFDSSRSELPVDLVKTAPPPQSLPLPVPRNTARGCDACRGRNLECDGTTPCYNCTLGRYSCVWTSDRQASFGDIS